MAERAGSERSGALAARLRTASAALIALVEPIRDDRWMDVPGAGVWSIGKDVEHVAEAAVYHLWIARGTIGEKVSSRRPAIERNRMTTQLSPVEAVELVRQRTEEAASLLLALTDQQLDLPTRPPRANGQVLADTIAKVMIGHYDLHRSVIEAKLR